MALTACLAAALLCLGPQVSKNLAVKMSNLEEQCARKQQARARARMLRRLGATLRARAGARCACLLAAVLLTSGAARCVLVRVLLLQKAHDTVELKKQIEQMLQAM
jgi:hypothetical protein